MDSRCLPASSISHWLREPYILTGYRPIGLSAFSCVRSVFRTDNNEIANFWTHFLPFLLWLYWLSGSFSDITRDTRYFPILCYYLGGLSYTFLSSFAHLFNVISHKFRHFCFFMDYSGIALYEMGGIILSYYVYRPLNRPTFQYEYTYLGLGALITMSVVPITCLSRFYWRKYRFLIRGVAYAQPFLWSNGVVYILYLFPDGSEQCIYEQVYSHFAIAALSILLFFLFASKIPEKFAPGRFDIIGSSHQWAHACSATATTIHLCIIRRDMENRWHELSKQEIQPKMLTTLGLLLFSAFWMIGISLFIFVFVYKDKLVENDQQINKEE